MGTVRFWGVMASLNALIWWGSASNLNRLMGVVCLAFAAYQMAKEIVGDGDG